MKLKNHEVHIWSGKLSLSGEALESALSHLNLEEKARANRLVSPIHQKRFIAARYMLRHVISLYLNIKPDEVTFIYNTHRKPSLANPQIPIEFNLSHSEDIAVLALNLDHLIGVDIEKMKETYESGIVERYFSEDEKSSLNNLAKDQQNIAFYRLWAKKEALIKANGKGLSTSLSSFSVSPKEETEMIQFEGMNWKVISLPIHHDYQSALACCPENNHISHFEYPPI